MEINQLTINLTSISWDRTLNASSMMPVKREKIKDVNMQ